MIALTDLLQQLKKARRSGSGYVALCPAHDDREPSLSITEGSTGAILLNCHAGCTFDAIAAALNLKPADLLPDRQSVEPRRSGRLVASYVYQNAEGISVARKQRFTDDAGGKTFRWERPDPANAGQWIPGGNDAPLYRLPGLLAAQPGELVVIVEGEKDADRLASLGFVATTTPNGAAAKWRDSDSAFFAGRRVAIIADDDEPGRKKAKSTADALTGTAAAVGIVTLPNPGAIKGFDASDFLTSGGTPERLREILERFDVPRLPAEVTPPEVLEDRVMALWRRGGPERGIYPGWPALKNLFRPKLGQLAVITGSPNAGKSTWLDDLVIRTSCVDDEPGSEACARWEWVIFSAEQYPIERHTSMLAQKLSGKPFGDGPSTKMNETEVRTALKVLNQYVTILDPSFSSLNIDRILEIAAELNGRRKRHALLIDPFNVLAATSRGKGESEHDFINTFLSKLRTFAQAEQMFVAVVAHPTKLKREDGDDEYPRVRPWDISGSAHWFNHTDAIVSVWRAMKDEARIDSGEVEIHVSKIRFQPECGTLGMAKLYFDRVTTRYTDEPRVPRAVAAPLQARERRDGKLFAAGGHA